MSVRQQRPVRGVANILTTPGMHTARRTASSVALASIENRRYLLRGSNTGVTSIIDPPPRRCRGQLFSTEVISARHRCT